MLCFVLCAAGLQAVDKVAPIRIEPVIRHFEKAPHEPGTVAVEEEPRLRSVAILRRRSVAIAFEKTKGNQRIEKIRRRARMQIEGIPQLLPCLRTAAELGSVARSSGPTDPRVAELQGRLRTLGVLNILVLVSAVWAMVYKPTL